MIIHIIQKIYDYILNSDDKEKEIKELIEFYEEDIKKEFKNFSEEEIIKAEKAVIFYLNSFTNWKIDFLSKNEAFNEFIKKYNFKIKMSINESITEFKNLQEIDEIYLIYKKFADSLLEFETDFEKVYTTLLFLNYKMDWENDDEIINLKIRKKIPLNKKEEEKLANIRSHKCIQTGLAVCLGFNNAYETIMHFLNIPTVNIIIKEERYHILSATKIDGKWYFIEPGTSHVFLGKILIAIKRQQNELILKQYKEEMRVFKGKEYAKSLIDFKFIETLQEDILKYDKEFRKTNNLENQKEMNISGENYFTFITDEDIELVEFKNAENRELATIKKEYVKILENILNSKINKKISKEFADKIILVEKEIKEFKESLKKQ